MDIGEPWKISLTAREAKRYRRLHSSRSNLAIASQCASLLLKKKWHEPVWSRKRVVRFQQYCVTTTCITAYSRAFLDPKDWQKEIISIAPLTSPLDKFHDQLIDLRHEVFAHTDLRHVVIEPIRLLGGVSAMGVIHDTVLKPSECEMVIELTTHFSKVMSELSTEIVNAVLVTSSN